jgi:hypothetical protein
MFKTRRSRERIEDVAEDTEVILNSWKKFLDRD